jgi:hypothetical protein
MPAARHGQINVLWCHQTPGKISDVMRCMTKVIAMHGLGS